MQQRQVGTRGMIRSIAAGTGILVGVLASSVATAPVATACSGPTPTIADAAKTADAIYLGDIVWTPTGSQAGIPRSAFDLDVERTIRGADQDTVKVRGLMGSPCGDTIRATTGDRVILATGIDWQPRYLAGIWQVDAAGNVQTDAGPVNVAAVEASVAAAPDTSTAASLAPATSSDLRAIVVLTVFLTTFAWCLRRPAGRAA